MSAAVLLPFICRGQGSRYIYLPRRKSG